MSPKGDPKGGRPRKDEAGPAKMQSYRLSPRTIQAIREGARRRGMSQADFIAHAVDAVEDPASPGG